MAEMAIRAEGLGKRYTIGRAREGTQLLLREALATRARQAARRASDVLHGRALIEGDRLEEIWAVRDVSLQIRFGEVVGILGRNGAGKSTLLKMLGRITEPTRGRAEIHGRLASLLEIGTGFHPELTGRENIFLNGAILGMTRAEIKARFDEIVDFAGIERFLETPVKRYSSGMYVRLAFAVAAHLQSDIVVIDEVLAVGDAEFQKKCLGKMQDISGQGRAVLFVSHNLAALSQLCAFGLLLKEGRMEYYGAIDDAVGRYLDTGHGDAVWQRKSPPREGAEAEIVEIRLTRPDDTPSARFSRDERIVVTLHLSCAGKIPGCQVAVRVSTAQGVPVFTTTNVDQAAGVLPLERGFHRFRFEIPQFFLATGRYALVVAINIPRVHTIDAVIDELSFEVESCAAEGLMQADDRKGVVTPAISWCHDLV